MVCACPKGLHLQPDGMICSEFHPCSQWGVCSQKCQARKSRHKCICHEGYQLADDGFTCKSIGVYLFESLFCCKLDFEHRKFYHVKHLYYLSRNEVVLEKFIVCIGFLYNFCWCQFYDNSANLIGDSQSKFYNHSDLACNILITIEKIH